MVCMVRKSSRDEQQANSSPHTFWFEKGEKPEFVAMPSGKNVEFYSGLKRGKLNLLVLPCRENGFRPPVRSCSLKQPGCVKGKRLIVLDSLLEYLRAHTTEELPKLEN